MDPIIVARARKHKENCVFKALQLNSRRCARQKNSKFAVTFRVISERFGGGVLHNSDALNRAARNSFQLKASLMDLRACADSASFTAEKS